MEKGAIMDMFPPTSVLDVEKWKTAIFRFCSFNITGQYGGTKMVQRFAKNQTDKSIIK